MYGAFRQPVEPSKEDQILSYCQLAVQTYCFAEHADAAANLVIVRTSPQNAHLPACGLDQSGDEPESRALPGSIRPQQPENLPVPYFKGETAHGG